MSMGARTGESRTSRRVFIVLRRLAVAEARKRPGRVIVTVVMIALGAGALSTALVVGASVRSAVEEGLVVQYDGIDIVDNAGLSTTQDAIGTGGGGTGISRNDVTEITALPGVEATGSVFNTVAVAQVGDLTRGVTLSSLNSNPDFVWQDWSEGRAPTASNEIGLTPYTLDQLGIRLGDQVAIGRPSTGAGLVRVVGVIDTHGSREQDSSAFGVVTEQVVRNLSGLDAPNEVMIATVPGTDLDALISDINRVAPTGLPQTTEDILNADRGVALTQINAMEAVVTALAAVSCLVAAITSATTAGASLASRRRSWALLRCVGGSRRQVAGLVTGESLLLGLLGGIIGVVVGLGLALATFPVIGLVPGLPELRGSSYTVEATAIWIPVVVALLLAAAGSVVPAVLAARIPPSAALKTSSNPAKPVKRWRVALTAGVLVVGAVLAYLASDGGSGMVVLVGVLLSVAAFATLIPQILVAAARVGVARARSTDSRLGYTDVLRRPRAATIEAVAVILAVGMIALSWVALSSVQEATSARLSATDSPDLVVGAVVSASPVSQETLDQIAAVPGIETAVPVPFGTDVSIVGNGTDGRVTLTTGTAAGRADELGSALPLGSPVSDVRGDTVYLPATPFPAFYADKTVRLIGPDGTVRGLKVAYVEGLQLPSLVSPDVLAKVSADPQVRQVWIALADGIDRAKVVDELTGVAIQSGELPISGPTILDIRTASAFTTARAAAVAILAISVLVAVIGAASTAALSIAERSREHATLRALGLERAKLGRLLATRIVFVGLLAGLLGVAMGSFLGVVASRLVASTLTLEPRTSLPMVPVLAFVVVTVLAVRIAALLPIERASYIPPSRALAQA